MTKAASAFTVATVIYSSLPKTECQVLEPENIWQDLHLKLCFFLGSVFFSILLGWHRALSLITIIPASFGAPFKTVTFDYRIKSRDITLPTKVCLVKIMVFPVVIYGCESWTIKKVERRRIDTFELWCWRRHLRVPWTARRSNQSILKEISPEHSLEGLMLKLKLQYFDHLMQRTDSFEKTLMMGKIEGGKRREQQRIR